MKLKLLFNMPGHALACSLAVGLALGTAGNLAAGAEIDNYGFAIEREPGVTLEDFFTAALNNNPELAIARERWNIGTYRKDAATGQLLPQINASANVSDNERQAQQEPVEEYRGKRYTLQMNQVLFNWQAFSARSQASLMENLAEAEYYAALGELLTNIADRYLTVLQAEDALYSIDAEVEAMTNQINQIQSLYDRQLAQITDLYSARARLAAIQAERVVLESDLAISREALRAGTGLEVGNLSRLPEEVEVTPLEDNLSQWIERTLANNRRIEARDYALQVADKQISQQRGAYMPEVSLILQHQISDVGFENAPISEIDSTYVGLNFTMPIFAGGANRAAVREAISQRNIAENELRQTEMDILEGTRTAYFQVIAGQSLIEAGQVLAESTATSYTAMQRGFELGAVTSVDLLNALRDRYSAERDLQKARYDYIRANLMLRREAGTLTAEDLMDVSAMLNQPFRPAPAP